MISMIRHMKLSVDSSMTWVVRHSASN